MDDMAAHVHYILFEGQILLPWVEDLPVTPEDAVVMALLATWASTPEVQHLLETRQPGSCLDPTRDRPGPDPGVSPRL